ncbi:MerR family transcriptional regulator [Actinoplanes sp. CA-030573]|uniref:MerR family transcriptional regulator n=1 Tax=Actinoplanes sp. CA-030573 TaxID=3239898 RepID=UPI003D905B32
MNLSRQGGGSGLGGGSLLGIGEFGRLAGLSVKALRLYDVSGLLPADSVDPDSGYRRYRADQVERARRIALLRRLDMPLAVVAEVLDAGDDEQALVRLDRWWVSQEAAMQARRGSFGWLRAQVADGAALPELRYEVGVRDVRDTKVAAIRTEVYQQSLVEAIRLAECAIRCHLDDERAVHTPEHWVIYHGPVTPDTEATIEVCVPFSGRVEPEGDIVIRLEPAHRQVFATVARDDCFYPRIMRAYEAVATHISVHGLRTAGPEREIYLNYWDRIGGADPFAHVAQPIEE